MKKKVWDITVKDNPNRVVMGENDEFYTTDTEAYLVFNLDDKNFNPATAVLTLENRNDGSLKNETVDVVDGLIEWEMPQRYIEHFGSWQGQLVYEDTKDGQPELYTSATFSFVVNAHIGDKKKPSLVEIENWEKFIRDGTELIETWEDMEVLRQANEAQRQANYQELLETGVLQTNINTKLEALEEEYAPRLTNLEQNKADKGDVGGIENLDSSHIVDALGYMPISATDVPDPTWANLQNKPTEFNPTSHIHSINDVTGLRAELDSVPVNRFELSVKVSSFGGIPDDESVDNLSAIQEAIDYVHNEGGGKVVFDGIYYTDATIYLKDNVYLDGNNRSGGVKLIHTAQPFYDLFRIVKISNWGITGLYIDSSFEERSVPYDISKVGQSEIMISLEGADDGFVTNNEVYGNGKWLFSSHAGATPYRVTDYSTNVRVEYNYFEWFAGQSTQSPNMPEGVFLDNTAVYFDAWDYTFKDNTIITEFYSQTMTALELHGALVTATNNRLIGFRRGVIIVSFPLDPIKEVIVEDNYIYFEGNVIEKCLQGITTTIFEGYNLDSVSILNNRVYPDPTVFVSFASFHGILFVDGDPNANIKALQIEGNYIYFDPWLKSFDDSDHVANYTGIRIGIGVHEGLSISNNTVINAPATGITLLNHSQGQVTVKSGVIQNNTIINAGRNTNMETEEWNPRTAIRVVDSARTKIEQLIIGENNIIDTRENGTYFTAPTYVGGNAYLKPQNILTTDGVIHDTGSVQELTKAHVETALGYVPADEADLSTDSVTLQGRSPSNFIEVVNHGATGNYARPVGGISVLWIGTVEPQNAIDNDIWIGG